MTPIDKRRNEISILVEKLNNCINQDQFVNIHIYNGSITVRNSIIPDEISIDEESITINSKCFYLRIDKLEDIEYEEENNTICIYIPEGDIYFDFLG